MAEPRTEPSTARLQGAQEKHKQEWADKNPIEEQSGGNERNSENWEQQQPTEKDIAKFGGGTDDFNNVAHKAHLRHVVRQVRHLRAGRRRAGTRRRRRDGHARLSARAAAGVDDKALLSEVPGRPKAVKVRSVSIPEHAPQCTTRLNVPAMVIELGGLTGNYWHDFTDVLVPLFIGARRFNGEVQLLVVNLLPFWVDKYKRIFGCVMCLVELWLLKNLL